MLDQRRSAVLRTIVEEYVASAQPVGSATVSEVAGLTVSPATIRNDMVFLEHEGYVVQPHTSAGRIPSDVGYRFFVDHYADAGSLPPKARAAIQKFFTSSGADFESLLRETARLLSGLTHLAAVVVAPHLEDSTLHSVQLTRLDPHRLLLVLVTRAGRVANVVVDAETEIAADRIEAASAILSEILVGVNDWATLPTNVEVGDRDVDVIVRLVLDVVAEATDSPTELFIGGAGSLAEAFDAIDDVRDLLSFLDERTAVVEVLEAALDASRSEVQVRIGSEIPTDEMRRASVVMSPYHSGTALGLIALVGPTRMNYTRAMSTLSSVSDELEQVLSA